MSDQPMPGDWELTDEQIDQLLVRFDQTKPKLQRRIIARFIVQTSAAEARAAQLEAALREMIVCWESLWESERQRMPPDWPQALYAARQALEETP